MTETMDWEAELAWSKIDPAGGRDFYFFIRDSAIKALDRGIDELLALKREHECKLRSWNAVALLASRLDEDFRRMVDSELFTKTVSDLDDHAFLLYADGTKITLGRWIECGRQVTDTLRQGCGVPDEKKQELVRIGSELAKAETLRDFLKGYVDLAEKDFRLRNAPVRYKTRLFRDVTKLVNALVAMGAKINLDVQPDFVQPIRDEIASIKGMAAKTQRVCRMAKKTIDRIGDRFWSEAGSWERLNKVA